MKKFLVTIAAVGMVLTGCTKNETEGIDIPNPDVIAFSTSTSRAAVADLGTLTGDPGGFKVYGVTANVSNEWYENVDGTNNYAYASNTWGWVGTDAVWPTTEASYPMTFYAMYPVKELSTVNKVDRLSDNITIAATAAQQTDMLSARASTVGKPASGMISLTFRHILSKVNFGVIAGHEMTPEVRSVAVRNVHSKNTYDYIQQTWGGTTTDAVGYDYYVVEADGTPFTTVGNSDEDAVTQFYSGTHSNHLMLMPQSTGAPVAWDKTSAGLATGAYIEVVYRITDSGSGTAEDYVGYTAGAKYLTDYPSFVENNSGWGTTYTGGLGTEGDTQYNGALYVKVGFPLTLNWEQGKGYTYNICLGTANSSNGYYTSPNYFDNQGTETNVPVIGPDNQPVDPGDPVTDGIINFLIDVDPWDDTTPTSLQ